MGEDSGESIAEILGMQTKTFDRLDYLREAGFIESENWGSPQVFSARGEILQGRLLFTGFHGDVVWDRNSHVVGPDIIRCDASGSGLTEFRLRVGFIHLPLAFLGCTSHSSIHRISTSAEMKPWSLMNKYDRLIPRRLLEEAGVPRKLFGTKKRAATVDLREEDMKAVMRRESMEDFWRYSGEHWNHYVVINAMMTKLIGYIHKSNQFLNRQISDAFEHWLGVHLKLPLFVPHRLRVLTYGYVRRESLLFHWAVEKLLPRYSVCGDWVRGRREPREERLGVAAR
jgi:hypothetical protein